MSARWKLLLVPAAGFAVALGMHLWGLGLPNAFIGDEHYFVYGARHTLQHESYIDAHPPLGKLQIALMIKIFGDQPVVWRMWGAIMGALIVPLMWFLTWRLSKNKRAAGLAMILALLDGFILVESRSAMINTSYVAYALASLAAILVAVENKKPWPWLIAAGIFFGLAVSVKWLALLVLMPAISVWLWPSWFGLKRAAAVGNRKIIGQTLLFLFFVPLAIYEAIWEVHFSLTGMAHQTVLTNLFLFHYHTTGNVGHLYAQTWWQWPALSQPFPYYVSMTGGQVASIWSMGNPWVWWTGWPIAAAALWWGRKEKTWRLPLVFMAANWLPFALIQRNMFLYHAFPCGCFLIILLGLIGAKLWANHKKAVCTYAVVTAIVFAWFLPWYVGWPLSQKQNNWRQWLPGWTLKQSRVTASGG